MAMRHISMPKTLVTVATVAVALALAVGINAQLNLPTFVVGITNTTTTPAVGTTAQGYIKAECGGPRARDVPNNGLVTMFDCYPSATGAAFDMTYSARLPNDANGNEVWHSGTISIYCAPGHQVAQAGDATSAEFTLTGSGTGITASSLHCNYPRPPDPGDAQGD